MKRKQYFFVSWKLEWICNNITFYCSKKNTVNSLRFIWNASICEWLENAMIMITATHFNCSPRRITRSTPSCNGENDSNCYRWRELRDQKRNLISLDSKTPTSADCWRDATTKWRHVKVASAARWKSPLNRKMATACCKMTGGEIFIPTIITQRYLVQNARGERPWFLQTIYFIHA